LSEKKIAIVGVGNTIMGDEGFGVEVVNQLDKKICSKSIQLIDAGTGFFNIVSELRDYDKVFIIDVVHGGQRAGTVYRFGMEDLENSTHTALSLHDFGVIESIKMESIVGKVPEEFVFFGIEPDRIEFSMELSPVVKGKVHYVIEKILQELQQGGVTDLEL
jgi:hydrogenase maturation protease